MIHFESNTHDRWLLHSLGVDMNSGPGPDAAWLWRETQRHLERGLDLMERWRRRREIQEAAAASRLQSDLDFIAGLRREAKETDGAPC